MAEIEMVALLISSLPTLLVCILVSSLFWLRKWQKTLYSHLPPGPPSLPIIGHLHLLGKLPHQSLHQLSTTYGPLISLRFGSIPAILASTPHMAREILQTHDLAFASRPRLAAGVYCLFNCTDIALAPYGPYWKLMRQLCATDLFSNKRIESFRPIRTQEVAALLQSILADSTMGKEVPVVSRLMSATNNIISRIVLGKRFSELASSTHDPSANIVSLLSEMLELLGVYNVGDFIPYLEWLDLQGHVKRMKVVGGKLRTVLQDVIDSRREFNRANPSPPKDLLDVLLSASEESHRDVLITDDNIKAVLVDMYAGGTDTSAFTVEWALAELLKNPTTMKKLQDEIESVVGKERLVQESDISQLPYLRGVVKETMRLHPVLPMLQHESTKPCQIAGYDIPAKTRAYIHVWAIGRDPKVWEKPMEFLPERFIGSNIDVRGQHFELLPFGTGRRGCPGWSLGLLNVQLMLASLMHGFVWCPSKLDHLDMSEKFGIAVVKAKPLLALATPKLPLHLYNIGTTPSN